MPWAFAHRSFLSAALGDDLEATVREAIQAALNADGNDGPQSLCTELVTQAQRRSWDFEHLRAKDDDVTRGILQVR